MAIDMDNQIRVGIVSSVNPENATAKVIYPDKDDMMSGDLKIVSHWSRLNKSYWMPDIEEQVLVLMDPNSKNLNEGWIIGSYYSEVDKAPISDFDKVHIKFKDDSSIQYDRKNHVLDIDIKGDINIRATGHIVINGKRIDIN